MKGRPYKLGGTIDLREHFGIWDRCGNTRFFRKQSPWSEIYLNPINGILVSARRELAPNEGEPRYQLVVKDASRAGDVAVTRAFAVNQPWVKQAVERFFHHKALGWALDTIKEHTGREPMSGDRDLRYFLSFYKSGGERYRQEGSGFHVEFMLEEALEAILRTMGSMDEITVDYGRDLSREDLDEALVDRGILECV